MTGRGVPPAAALPEIEERGSAQVRTDRAVEIEGAVLLKFYFGPLLLGRRQLRLRVIDMAGDSERSGHLETRPDMRSLASNQHGFLFRSAPIEGTLPVYTKIGHAIRYVPQQFERHFIDLSTDYDAYLRGFSSKTRATLQRKVRKFFELAGGAEFRSYRTTEEFAEFYVAARAISAQTYQERLYRAGLPDTVEFRDEMFRLATADKVRAYLLFVNGKPVSYLYCPVDNGRLIYAYLGFDPNYARHSPGTVLQMLALAEIFRERCFSSFDFTEGEGDHKKLFGNRSCKCANIYFLRNSLAMQVLVQAHIRIDRIGNDLVRFADRLGLRQRLRRHLRRQA